MKNKCTIVFNMKPLCTRDLLVVSGQPFPDSKMKARLAKLGYSITQARTTSEAIEAVSKRNFCACIIDIIYDGGNDYINITEKIRAKRDLPFLFLYGNNEETETDRTGAFVSYGYIEINAPAGIIDLCISSAVRLYNEKKNQKFSELFDNMTDAVAIYTAVDDGQDFIFSDFNKAAERIENVTKEEVIGRRVTDVFPGVKNFGILEIFRKVWMTGKPEHFPLSLYEDDRIAGWKENYVFKTPSGEIAAVYHDITAQKQMEEELKLGRELLNSTQRMASIGGWEWDINRKKMNWTDETYRLHGIQISDGKVAGCELIKKSICCYDPEDRPRIQSAFRNCITKGIPYSMELPFTKYSGERIWIQTIAEAVEKDGEIIKVRGHIADITERRNYEENIRIQLKEKEVLLKEVHHRIKNNIMSIIATLHFKNSRLENDETVQVLKEIIGRLESMRLVYDKMLISDNYEKTSVKNYMEDLIKALVRLKPEDKDIYLEESIENLSLEIRTISILGIIVNELITNCIKYAFTGKKAGKICIELKSEKNRISLAVIDDGKGLPDGFTIEESKGFGFMLVKMLTEQLGGTICLLSSSGTKCHLSFPMDECA